MSSQALPLGREPPSKSVLLLDISRLIWRARRRGPSGIDRVVDCDQAAPSPAAQRAALRAEIS